MYGEDALRNFLQACRAAYNEFVVYHNFRHVVDVLQAVFYFLLQVGTLPPYPSDSVAPNAGKRLSPIAILLKPFDALTLLITAIGHDVGHPGVNNAFLVALRVPLAQLYNDNSVLEAFHCAAYSQILRRYWKAAFEDLDLRKLLIKSILATDMGVHFKYMADLGNLQEKLHHNKGTDGWSPQVLDEYKTLACGLLIKCADISNVVRYSNQICSFIANKMQARPFRVAAKWSDVLQLEFARQGEMEKDVGIPTCLFGGPPELGNLTKLAMSQISFMNMSAYPLFESVTDILPDMRFAVDEIKANLKIWKGKIEEEKAKDESQSEATKYSHDGFQSPRSGSPDRMFAGSPDFAISPEASHPEGLPASGSLPSLPNEPPMLTLQSLPNFSPPQSSGGSSSALNTRNASEPQSYEPSRHPSSHHSGSPRIGAQPSMTSSRRSSGAYPGANILGPDLSSRRSSNTMPTQLQIGPGSTSFDPALRSAENVQLASRPRQGQSEGGAGSAHRGSKGSDGDNGTSHPFHVNSRYFSPFHSDRQSTQHSSGRYSGLSSQDRYSNATSGAHTGASHALPNSPTETQATSFLTDNSDVGRGDDETSVVPDVVNMERPGSSARFLGGLDGAYDRNEAVATAPHMNGHTHVGGDRVVRKKNSRFRFQDRLQDLFKRKREGSQRSQSP